MICDKCGSEIEENVKFCTTCGNKLNNGPQQVAYNQQMSYNQTQQPAYNSGNMNVAIQTTNPANKGKVVKKKSKSSKSIVLVVAVLAVIIIGAVLINSLLSGDGQASSSKIDFFEIVDIGYTGAVPNAEVKMTLKKDKIEEYAYFLGHDISSFEVVGNVADGETIIIILNDSYVMDLQENYGIIIKETEKEIVVDYDVVYADEEEDFSDAIIEEMRVMAEEYINQDVYTRFQYSPDMITLGETKYYGEVLNYKNDTYIRYYIAYETMVTINDPANGVNATMPIYHYVFLDNWAVVDGGESYVRTLPVHIYPENEIRIENASGEKMDYPFPGNETPEYDNLEFKTLDRE